jgi:hypothetical protein
MLKGIFFAIKLRLKRYMEKHETAPFYKIIFNPKFILSNVRKSFTGHVILNASAILIT